MSQTLKGIGTLWVEGPLSFLEQMCLLSFVAQGHKVTLFHYGEIANVPQDIEVIDAREIHDPAKIIYNKQFGTPVVQSDIFRLHMLYRTDLMWADSDVLCLKPFDLPGDHVFGYFKRRQLCNAIIGLPHDSPGLKAYFDYVQDEYPIPPNLSPEDRERMLALKAAGEVKHASEQAHSVYGPGVFTHFMEQSGEIAHATQASVFYPLPFRQAGQISDIHVRDFRAAYIKKDTLGIHLWGRRIRWWVSGRGIQRYSLMDRTLRSLGIDPTKAPIPKARRKARA
ncbi:MULTISPECIES: hypothetical protein [unclassified Yoonia]|uniref:hypothetical protein n=1 Tax=unclassified Yoonia TaxID=2629118 RepID=UPI002AFE641D|nr:MULTISPECIES: hypothetical protein [unclassified Yoonia]